MRILVTGATGFLGSAAALGLQQVGHKVTGTGRNLGKGRALENQGVHFVAADLRVSHSIAPLLTDIDAVLHCAARSSLWGQWDDFVLDNVTPSIYLAKACAERGLRLVHISTPSVYNATGLTRQVPESTPIGPRFDSLYARSKYLAEVQVRSALPDATILRPRGLYGPGDTTIIPRLLQALNTGKLPRLTTTEIHTELTHISNVVHAARLALERPAAGVFNITDGETIPLWATIDRLADVLGVPRPRQVLPARVVEYAATLLESAYRLRRNTSEPPLTASGVRLLTRPMTLDLKRARTLLGYVPPIHPKTGLESVFGGLVR